MIGVVVDYIDNTAESWNIFSCLNELSKKTECYLFADNIKALPQHNNFAILQQASLFEHKGILIGTSLLNSQMINNALFADKKYFYIQNLEWMNVENLNFLQLKNVVHNPELKLISRGKTHHKIISKLFKKPEHMIVNWDVKELEKELL